MMNSRVNFPTDGSSALKPERFASSTGARIIVFPGGALEANASSTRAQIAIEGQRKPRLLDALIDAAYSASESFLYSDLVSSLREGSAKGLNDKCLSPAQEAVFALACIGFGLLILMASL